MLTNDGGYAIAGYTYSFGAGERDLWVIKTCVESDLAWTDSTPNTITLYRGATDPTGTTSASASGRSKKPHNPMHA